MMDRPGSIREHVNGMRRRNPDFEPFLVSKVNNDGTIYVRKNEWPEDCFITVPLTRGTPAASEGDSVFVAYEEGDRQRPFYHGMGKKGAGILKKAKLNFMMFGDGQWVTPESDRLNSCGLTIPSKQIRIKLDGSTPGTISTIDSFNRFVTGPELPGRWQDFVTNIDQTGLLAFTVPDGTGGTVTVLACYYTLWLGVSYINGYTGQIREYSIAGSSSGISDRTIWFTEALEGRAGTPSVNSAADRRQGYFFIDTVTDPMGLYVMALETGIYNLRRSDNTMRKSNWVPDVNFPSNIGSVSAYGDYVIGCGWAGYDKSEAALTSFNVMMQGADPAAAYLQDPTFGWQDRIKLPDDSSRAVLRIYTRFTLAEDPGNYGLSFGYNNIDLKGIIPGKTIRRIYSNGIHFRLSRALLTSSGSPLTAPSGGELALAPRVHSNIQSLRWPWLISGTRAEFWISVCAQVDGSTSAEPGQSYWTLCAVTPKTRTMTAKNQLVTPFSPALNPRFPDLLATRESEIGIAATASRSVDGGDINFYPEAYRISASFGSVIYLAGYHYEGIDSADPPDKWSEVDRWIDHPLPGDLTSDNYTRESPSNDVGLDAIVPGAGASPSGSFDLNGNHYAAVSEPIHFLDNLTPDTLVLDPGGLRMPGTGTPVYIKVTVTKTDGYSTMYAAHKKSNRHWTKGHKTWLVRTSEDGFSRIKKDISERFTWNNSTADRAKDLPLLGCVWQVTPVGQYVFVLRQCYWSVTSGKPDQTKREPYLEIYSKELNLLQKISLHPPTDTGRALFGIYDLAPRMRVGFDAAGSAWAEICTEWITLTDYNAINRLELVQHLKTEIKYKAALERTDHLWQGKKEAGIPLPGEMSNIVFHGDRAYWIEGNNSVVQYAPP